MSVRLTRQYSDVLTSGGNGTTRLTRQYGEVLASGGDGKVRLTRQYVEVLTPAFDVSVIQTLAIVDVATGTLDTEITGIGSDTLVIIDTATADLFHNITDTLAIVDDAAVLHELAQQDVTDVLLLVQDVTNNIKQESVNDPLGIQQTVTFAGPKNLAVAANMSIIDVAEGHLAIINKSVNDALVIVDSAGLIIELSVSDTLTMTDEAVRKIVAENTLALVQTVVAGKGNSALDILDLTLLVHANGIYQRSGANVLNIQQGLSYVLLNDCTERLYTPFVGSGSGEYTPPSVIVPTLASQTLTLTYPYVTPTTTLVLRNPNFANKDRLTFNRVNRETRGGTLIVFADTKWPKIQQLTLEIDALSSQQALNILTFLQDSLGQEIGLLDWENRQWRGIITNPETDIVHSARNARSVVIEFEGELV
jgi:hypothetical protein